MTRPLIVALAVVSALLLVALGCAAQPAVHEALPATHASSSPFDLDAEPSALDDIVAVEYPIDAVDAVRQSRFDVEDPDATERAYREVWALLNAMLGEGAFAHPDAGLTLVPATDDEPAHLVLRASHAEQAAAAHVFSAIAEQPDDQFLAFEIRPLVVPLDAWSRVGVRLYPVGSNLHTVLDEDSAAQALARLDNDTPGARPMTAPRLTTFCGQRGELTVANQIAYISDFTVTRTSDATVVDPVIAVLTEGIRVAARGIVVGESVILDVEFDSSSLRRPIATAQVDLGAGTAVTIELPEHVTLKLAARVSVPLGSWLLLVGAPVLDGVGGDSAYRQCMLIRSSLTDGLGN